MVTSLPEKVYATSQQVCSTRVAVMDVISIADVDGDADWDADVDMIARLA